MTQDDFEGSLILEKLASVRLMDDFFDAVDSDDLESVVSLLEEVDVDEDSIEEILRKIKEGRD